LPAAVVVVKALIISMSEKVAEVSIAIGDEY
jgi:hypothetical protein